MISRKIICLLVSLYWLQSAAAQDKTVIRASVDKKKILIGEPMLLTIEAELQANSTAKFITIDTIPHFELSGKPGIDSSSSGSGVKIKAVYTITSFDSGHWVIPSFVLAKNIRTDTIPVDVVFSDFDPAQDYHDIKDILEVKPPRKKNNWWWYVAGGVLLLVIVILLLRRKKPVVAAKPRSVLSAFDEAMKELEQLKKERPAAKQYYSTLTDIFRLYVFRRKGILSLQKTTDDLILQLRDLDIEKDQFDKLSQSLRLGDFVKFAKYVPSADDDNNAFEEIRRSIITIEKKETELSTPAKK